MNYIIFNPLIKDNLNIFSSLIIMVVFYLTFQDALPSSFAFEYVEKLNKINNLLNIGNNTSETYINTNSSSQNIDTPTKLLTVSKYCFNFTWGSHGTNDGQFLRPHDIDFNSKGNVYVTDRDLNNIQIFTHDGKYISKFGTKGSNEAQFKIPYSISIDMENNVYVVDRGNDRIQKFTENGTFIQQWNSLSKNDKFASPEEISFDNNGNIFLADTGNDRIIKFDKNFNYILEWGKTGNDHGEFIHPHGLGIDSMGNVYVNELENMRIQKFDNNGTFIKQWGSEGKEDGQFTPLLEHLEVGLNNEVFMVDGAENPRIQKFDNNGTFITKFGKKGTEIGELEKPEHVNIDNSGSVYVVDRGNQRIQVFSPCL